MSSSIKPGSNGGVNNGTYKKSNTSTSHPLKQATLFGGNSQLKNATPLAHLVGEGVRSRIKREEEESLKNQR